MSDAIVTTLHPHAHTEARQAFEHKLVTHLIETKAAERKASLPTEDREWLNEKIVALREVIILWTTAVALADNLPLAHAEFLKIINKLGDNYTVQPYRTGVMHLEPRLAAIRDARKFAALTLPID